MDQNHAPFGNTVNAKNGILFYFIYFLLFRFWSKGKFKKNLF